MSDVLDPALPADASPAAFAEAMARAEHGKERVLVTRDGRAVAALVPIEDAEALEAIEDAEDSRLAAEAIARWDAEGRPPGTSLRELAARWGIDLASDWE
jgi:prevent-host-death family protein